MTRSEARAAGLPYYDEGRRACPANHEPTKRFVSNGKCFMCSRIYERERRRADAPNRTAKTKEWRRLNPDKVRDGNAKRDPVMLCEISRRWRKRYPEQAAITAAVSIAKRRGAKGRYTKDDIAEIMRLQSGKCAYCRVSVQHKRHVDHIMPIALGGTNHRSNLQVLCQRCNNRKYNKHPLDFARTLGLLV